MADWAHEGDPVPYPLGQMTAAELRRYRREIESALAPSGLPADAPAREDLKARLSEISAEEAGRT